MPPDNASSPYQTDTDPPTVTFRSADTTLALPYHLLRALQFGEKSIRLEFSEYQVAVRGTALGKLWRDLCAYRVREVAVCAGNASHALGDRIAKCQIQRIEIERTDKENGGEAPNFLEEES